MSPVTQSEALSITVGNWLIEEGYRLSRNGGDPLYSLDNRPDLGILGKKWKMEKSSSDVAFYLGHLFLQKGTWKLLVFGRSNLPEMRELADRMAIRFNVSINLQLEAEQSKWDPSNSPTPHPTLLDSLGCSCGPWFGVLSVIIGVFLLRRR